MEIKIMWTYYGWDFKEHCTRKANKSCTYHELYSARIALEHFLNNPSRYSEIKVSGVGNPRIISSHYRINTVELI